MRSSRLLTLALAIGLFVTTTTSNAGPQKRKKPRYPAPVSQAQPQPQEELKPISPRPLESVRELTILTYNVLNLKSSVGFHERQSDGSFLRKSDPAPKAQHQILGVVQAVREANPDIAILEEVEGVETLAEFNRQFLGSQYSTHIVRGNDGRGIEVGLIVKKDLPLTISFESHRDVTWKDPMMRGGTKPLFSRDLPTLIIRRASEPQGAPVLIVIGNHAKSKRDRAGDFESTVWRTAQYEGMAAIIDDYQRRFGADVPMIVGGDFNTNISNGKEIAPIRERLVEAFEIVGMPEQDRVTHTFHPQNGPTEYQQVDAIFVSKILEPSVLSAYVYRYKNSDGSVRPLPRTYGERSQNPSDHYPVVVKLKTSRIFPEAFGLPVPASQPDQQQADVQIR